MKKFLISLKIFLYDKEIEKKIILINKLYNELINNNKNFNNNNLNFSIKNILTQTLLMKILKKTIIKN